MTENHPTLLAAMEGQAPGSQHLLATSSSEQSEKALEFILHLPPSLPSSTFTFSGFLIPLQPLALLLLARRSIKSIKKLIFRMVPSQSPYMICSPKRTSACDLNTPKSFDWATCYAFGLGEAETWFIGPEAGSGFWRKRVKN
ncbi:hypothetical protein BGZ57DRAFT_957761 [Hyaloscypha finlandica]|nr:hypothetical protein BGZ57DRAFT_957761 [Hyaloscypha finlandica]